MVQLVENLPANAGDAGDIFEPEGDRPAGDRFEPWVGEDPLEERMVTHSITLIWGIT